MFDIINRMKDYLGRELTDDEFSLVASGMWPLRPMTAAEKERRKERLRQYAAEIDRHPVRFLVKFFLALAFVIFSWWLVRRNYNQAFDPTPPHRHRAP